MEYIFKKPKMRDLFKYNPTSHAPVLSKLVLNYNSTRFNPTPLRSK